MIIGEVLVQEGQSVAEGAILAKAGEGGLVSVQEQIFLFGCTTKTIK